MKEQWKYHAGKQRENWWKRLEIKGINKRVGNLCNMMGGKMGVRKNSEGTGERLCREKGKETYERKGK